MKLGTKKYLTASSILIGTCIGAGVLGIPFVAAQAGFLIVLLYILLIGMIIFFVNLFLGEIALRTKGDHQLIGYAKRYLGPEWKHIMEFAVIFGVYAALVAYMIGVGKSLSFLFFGNFNYELIFGIGFGVVMAGLLKGGIRSLKKFEKIGVLIILTLLVVIFAWFVKDVTFYNLSGINFSHALLPFGVVLFALMSFHAIPEVKLVLKRHEHLFRKVMITGTLVSVVFYVLFAFVVVGFMGDKTPEIATLALGTVFVVLGIFTMFTSYLANGNALRENFQFDERVKRFWSWVFASIIPIGLFVLVEVTNFFSFTRILSLGGVVSGGITALLILWMVGRAKKKGNRKPEYTTNASWWVIGIFAVVFILGVLRELLV
ncbi:amino acid permease [archaeon]|nr:amino acid permease [archaeon]